jgi:hypothetical protein
LEPKNESSSFGEKDLQELQSRAASRHRIHHLFFRRSPQAAAGLKPLASELISTEFSYILTRHFSRARAEK